MDSYAVRLAELVSCADAAYRRARAEVYDTMPLGERVDVDALSASQRDAFEDLIIAEAELAHFRHSHYDPAINDGPVAIDLSEGLPDNVTPLRAAR